MLHALLRHNNVIGLFSDYNLCMRMIDGLVSNKLINRKELNIRSYYDNSITIGKYDPESESESSENEIVEMYSEEHTTESIKTEDLDTDTRTKLKDERTNKSQLQYDLLLLKKEKEKMEESKRVYEVDIDLFNKFKQIKQRNPEFTIPELFINKWVLMTNLEKEGILTWENFYKRYSPHQLNTGYTALFGDSVVPNRSNEPSSSINLEKEAMMNRLKELHDTYDNQPTYDSDEDPNIPLTPEVLTNEL